MTSKVLDIEADPLQGRNDVPEAVVSGGEGIRAFGVSKLLFSINLHIFCQIKIPRLNFKDARLPIFTISTVRNLFPVI